MPHLSLEQRSEDFENSRLSIHWDSSIAHTIRTIFPMPTYQYEAVTASGVPVHGTAQAASDAELKQSLERRNLRLISCMPMSLDTLVHQQRSSLPRLYQLRIGEHLREALLTDLPAHEAVRAVSAEPWNHPLLSMAPWIQVVATMCWLVATSFWLLTGALWQAVVASAVVALVVSPMLWLTLHYLYKSRPQQILQNLARRLEAGETLSSAHSVLIPAELNAVMQSDMDDAGKARAAADLVPALLAGHTRSHEFALSMTGSLAILCAVLSVGYAGLLFIVPQFADIFEGFGVELPAVTLMVVQLGRLVEFFGLSGWFCLMGGMLLMLLLFSRALTSGPTMQLLEKLPVFGVAFRWAMQARVARTLAAMIRNGSSWSEALRVATYSSGFSKVREAGANIAQQMETGQSAVSSHYLLSGLPLSMLQTNSEQQSDEERRSAVAETFQSLSEMLTSATHGHGRLFAVILQILTIGVVSFVVAISVLAMFLPLINLLNGLA